MNELSREMYREHILELYKNPKNFGKLENANFSCRRFNSFCGDDLTMQVLIEGELVKDVKFFGKGCVLCVASASLLSERVRGESIERVRKIDRKELMEILRISVNAAREKCVLLALESLQEALDAKS